MKWRNPFLISVPLVALSCSGDNRALPRLLDTPAVGTARAGAGGANEEVVFVGSQGAGGPSGPPSSACGYQVIKATQDPAHLYFVFDRSGSMAEDGGGGVSKYDALRIAALNLVEQIGWRVQIGAAVFPSSRADGCGPGGEVLPMQDGDPKSYFDSGTRGPKATLLAETTSQLPRGGTPTAATLQALTPKLIGFGKNTFVLLATDGGPNCNPGLSCDSTSCIPNIEHTVGCNPQLNCCDPVQGKEGAQLDCLDAKATRDVVEQLRNAGVKTIVLGMPGSGPYAIFLDTLADAGGAARAASPRYYAVQDVKELGVTFAHIGAELVVSCDLSLMQKPVKQDLINVYYDNNLVPYNNKNGWSWLNTKAIHLQGQACQRLLGGEIKSVYVVEGCPTYLK